MSHQNDDLVYPTTVKTPSICHNTSTPGTAAVDVPPSQETICEEPIMVQHAHPAYSIDSSQSILAPNHNHHQVVDDSTLHVENIFLRVCGIP